MQITVYYENLLSTLTLSKMILSSALFLFGFFSSPLVVRYEIQILMKYPMWILKMMKNHFSLEWSFLKTGAVIFSLNSFSLLLNILSGFGVVLPSLFAVFLGINVGVIVYVTSGWKGTFSSFVNPVALLEFAAAWISLSVGFEIGKSILASRFSLDQLYVSISIYIFVILPLLFIACIIETVSIKIMKAHSNWA